jgi:hypothetical protein
LTPRRLAVIDGLELYVPADLTDEDIERQLRELRILDEKGRELDALDYATRTRALATELAGDGWPPDVIEFMRMAADAVEMIALQRNFVSSPIMQ